MYESFDFSSGLEGGVYLGYILEFFPLLTYIKWLKKIKSSSELNGSPGCHLPAIFQANKTTTVVRCDGCAMAPPCTLQTMLLQRKKKVFLTNFIVLLHDRKMVSIRICWQSKMEVLS